MRNPSQRTNRGSAIPRRAKNHCKDLRRFKKIKDKSQQVRSFTLAVLQSSSRHCHHSTGKNKKKNKIIIKTISFHEKNSLMRQKNSTALILLMTYLLISHSPTSSSCHCNSCRCCRWAKSTNSNRSSYRLHFSDDRILKRYRSIRCICNFPCHNTCLCCHFRN